MDEATSEQLRNILHDLSNLLTGIMVTGGLLQLSLQGDRRQHYAAEVCEGSERGATLVRQGRALLAEPEERSINVTEHRIC